jgi:hypothetical protein
MSPLDSIYVVSVSQHNSQCTEANCPVAYANRLPREILEMTATRDVDLAST